MVDNLKMILTKAANLSDEIAFIETAISAAGLNAHAQGMKSAPFGIQNGKEARTITIDFTGRMIESHRKTVQIILEDKQAELDGLLKQAFSIRKQITVE